jgi:hypothetical protein
MVNKNLQPISHPVLNLNSVFSQKLKISTCASESSLYFEGLILAEYKNNHLVTIGWIVGDMVGGGSSFHDTKLWVLEI